MKKLLLTVCLSIGAFLSTYANQLTVVNFLGTSTVYLSLNGFNLDGSYFSSSHIAYGPMTSTVYSDPTQVPLMSGATTTGRFSLAVGWCPPDLAVSSPAFSGPGTVQNVPAGSDCNGGQAFSISWQEGPTAPYNVVVFIL